MILTDTFIVERAEILTENRGGKMVPILRGVFGRCDEKNNNGRVYSKQLLEREVVRIGEAMKERRLLGELDHPSHDSVKLSNVSHLITNLSFKNNELMGECELLNTPSGKVAQALVEGGVKVGISSRGMGTLSEQSDGTKHVNEDFKLVTFDLVADPSTRGAFPGISESNQSNLVEEIVKDTLDTAAKEKIFTTLLKDKLREKTAWGKQHGKPTEVKSKSKKKPTAEDPFRNWEDFYSYNTRPPYYRKDDRGYEDAETVTEPDEVVENKYHALKNSLLESSDRELAEGKKLRALALAAALGSGGCKGPDCGPQVAREGPTVTDPGQQVRPEKPEKPAKKQPKETDFDDWRKEQRRKKLIGNPESTRVDTPPPGPETGPAPETSTPPPGRRRGTGWGHLLGTALAAAGGGYIGARGRDKRKGKESKGKPTPSIKASTENKYSSLATLLSESVNARKTQR